MRALITGATGFVGSHLARRLASDGDSVHLILRPHSTLNAVVGAETSLTTHIHDGSTENLVVLMRAVRPDVVFHLASYFVAEHTSSDIVELVNNNVTFGTQLLEAMAQTGVTRLVNAGTSWQHWHCADYRPVALYAATKQAFEANIRFYVESANLNVVTLKLFDTYGPGDPRKKLIPLLLERRHAEEPLALSPGEQRLDLVYIDDVVEAFVEAGNRLTGGQVKGHENFAVRSGSPVSMRELVERIEGVLGESLSIAWGARPYRSREVMTPWDGEKLPGWMPRIGLEEGLRRTRAGYESGGGTVSRRRTRLSFVAPCYNEADNIEPLCERIVKTCAENPMIDYEVVLVENGSDDGSAEIMRRLHEENPRVKMLRLSRNFGYQGAITAGLEHATGEWVAVLDGDQQDPPELIPRFLEKAFEGYDVVYGIHAVRKGSKLKNLAYKLFYRSYRVLAEIDVPADSGEFCVMHRRVVDVINAMPERQRFVRGLRSWAGFRQVGIHYVRDERAAGQAKFTLPGMFNLGMDGILSFSVVPLRLTMVAGLLTVLASFLIGIVQGMTRIMDWLGINDVPIVLPPGLTQINLMMAFLFGVTISCLGLVGEYVGRIYNEVKRRPTFLVSERLF